MTNHTDTDAAAAVIHPADIAAIVIYFVIVLIFGIVSSLRNRGSVGGYFLAGRSMNFIPVGASLFASNIGSGHFIGLAGSGAASGIGIASFELNALFVLMLLGWVFVPVYIASGVYTMPGYLRKRFGGQRIQVYLSVLALLLSIFTKVSADLFAGAVFIERSIKLDIYVAIIILLAIAALFTITGGLTAVIWTDFIQTVIMVVGAFALMIMSFIKVGGYNALRDKYFDSFPNLTRFNMAHNISNPYTDCGKPPGNSYHLFRSADDGDLPWTGITIGLTISAVWYWCSDQVIVQRALSAKNLTHSKAGCIVAGYLKILPMWLLVFPGMIARVLYPETIACADPVTCKAQCNQEAGCTNVAYPTLVMELMPPGARGIMLAVMMSALMSSLTSIFNSSSTIFTMDIWRKFRKNAGFIELMIVGRVFVIFMVAIGIAWIPVVKSFAELFHYIQSVTSYLAPPVCAIYVLAIAWPRCNEQGAFWGLMVGLVTGLIRFILEFLVYQKGRCGEAETGNMPDVIGKVHYLHFGIILFTIVVVVAVVVSLLTKPIAPEHLVRVTYWSKDSEEERVEFDEKILPSANNNAETEKTGAANPAYDDSNTSSKMGSKESVTPVSYNANPGDIELNTRVDTPDLQKGQLQTDTKAKSESQQTIVNNMDASQTTLNTQSDLHVAKGRGHVPWYRQAVNWVCGIEKPVELTEQEQRDMEKQHRSLYEVPKWRTITNLNAILLMAVAVFIWGFYA